MVVKADVREGGVQISAMSKIIHKSSTFFDCAHGRDGNWERIAKDRREGEDKERKGGRGEIYQRRVTASKTTVMGLAVRAVLAD